VLYDLQYPASIVDATRRILSTLWMKKCMLFSHHIVKTQDDADKKSAIQKCNIIQDWHH
jgi:hypothetical protein